MNYCVLYNQSKIFLEIKALKKLKKKKIFFLVKKEKEATKEKSYECVCDLRLGKYMKEKNMYRIETKIRSKILLGQDNVESS